MEVINPRRILDKVRKKKSVLKTDEYIEAQQKSFGLSQIVFEMGPNCNRSCSHCYGDYGPKRKGLPKVSIIKKTLEDSVGFPFTNILLTDGEPLRHENRNVMKVLANNSNNTPLRIITNGVFARTEQNTDKWFNFLKENGFDLNRNGNLINVSTGMTYKVHINNYFRIHESMKKIFPDVDIGEHFNYLFLRTESKGEGRLARCLILGLEHEFGKRRNWSLGQDKEGFLSIRVYPEKGSSIKIYYQDCDLDGRAKNMRIFDRTFPVRDLKVDDLGFYPEFLEGVYVSHNGDVSFGKSGACVRKGKFYGNVKDENFLDIVFRIKDDSIYNAYQLGGSRFMYYLGQQVNPDFEVRGRIRCDVCHSFFDNPKLVNAVRERLDNEGVVDTYKNYIKTIDLRRKRTL